jgi:cytochrome c biogenesis protein CcmG/thiol:disulfide interchange protein DsbE
VICRARFLTITGGLLGLGARRRGSDEGWHHVHGPNGLTLPANAPLDLTFVTVDGSVFRLADHRGVVVAVNLFASWCGPCVAEAPDVTAFAAAHPADTLVVSVDVGESAATAREFRLRFGIDYPVASDESSSVYKSIGMHAYPTTLFVRPSGLLACAFVGQMSRDDLETERAHALADSTASAPRRSA